MPCSKGISEKDAIDMACIIAARKEKIYDLEHILMNFIR